MRVAVAGGGAWGTALAIAAATAGDPGPVTLWMRDPAAADAIERTRRNARHLPGLLLPDNLRTTADPAALAAADAILVAVPTQALRAALGTLASALPSGAALVLCAKGIERGTLRFVDEVAAEIVPAAPVAILSGPSFAADVARGLPTAVTLAAAEGGLAAALALRLSGPALRIYRTSDVRGVALGGAAKNVLAIAVGIVDGRGLGESAKAALTTRGFAEMARVAAACGARPDTLMGLSGLGDLALSCASAGSRNFAFGRDLGRGVSPADAGGGRLAEGAFTADALLALAGRHRVPVPVTAAVSDVIAGKLPVDEAVALLMSRPLRTETD